MRKRHNSFLSAAGLTACLAAFLTGCAENLYDTDAALYRQYKYWDTSANDWTTYGGFDFLVETAFTHDEHRLFLTPHKQGLPNFQGAYIASAKELGFQKMAQTCGKDNYAVARAKAPENGRILDRYFYQYQNLTVGVTFSCKTAPKGVVPDSAEDRAYKWKNAARTIESVLGSDVIVYRLKSDKGLHQIKLRLMGDTGKSVTKIARQLMLDTCGSPSFDVVYQTADADYAYDQGTPYVLSRDNVYSYGFYCALKFR